MRPDGQRDVPLGTDYAEAVRRYDLCRTGQPVPPLVRPRKVKDAKEPPRPMRLPPLRAGKRRHIADAAWAGLPEWAKRMYLNAEGRSKGAKRHAFITLREFAEIVRRANGRCEVTGLPLEYDPQASRAPFAPSIDRIDCKLGYVYGNVRIVCFIANVAMNQWGFDPVVRFAEAVVARAVPQRLRPTV